MRVHRIFSPERLCHGEEVRLDANATRHLQQVLRLQDGDPIILFDGSGQDFHAELIIPDRHTCLARVDKIVTREDPPRLEIHLALGISRGERMDFAIQKAVELGVSSISPLFTERTVVKLRKDRLASREAHWQGIIRHACEQSGRSLLPRLHPATSYKHWINAFQGRGLLLDPDARQGLRQLPGPPPRSIALLAGPEGGLSTMERETALCKGLQGIRLGPRVLRTETAPLAAIAAIQALWGDFD